MALFGGFIDFMAQDIVFWPLVGICCLFVILAPILVILIILKLNKKSAVENRHTQRRSRDDDK